MKLITLSLALILLSASCDKPACENTNEVFTNFEPSDKQYKMELVKVTSSDADIRYWFDSFQESDQKKYILVDAVGENLCAKAQIEVRENTDGIDQLLANKGKGYSGAELSGLKFKTFSDEDATEFIFDGVESIIE